ncbi:MAG: GIN domain-containing protein [Bacteroidota bacterium]
MKRFFYILICCCWACSPDAINDCLSSAGSWQTTEVAVNDFNKIIIRQNVALKVTDSEEEFVRVSAGENRLEDVEISSENGTLAVQIKDLCTAGFSNPPVVVEVSTNHLTEIRNASQFSVTSTNVLTFPNLILISENNVMSDALAVGDFELAIDNESLVISNGGVSSYYLKGQTDLLGLYLYRGVGQVHAQELTAEAVHVEHKAYGDVWVYPTQSISGELRSRGNVFLANIPPVIEVETFYTGELIFD